MVLVIVLLAGLFLPALAAAKQKAKRIGCANILKSMGLGFRVFADDNGNKFPWHVPSNLGGSLGFTATEDIYRHFFVASNELCTPKILICPADTRTPAPTWATLRRTNVSYFVGVDAADRSPQTWLQGDRNLMTNEIPAGPGLVTLTTNSVWGWTRELHRRTGNVVLSDGSVRQVNRAGLAAMVRDASTNRLLIP